MKRKIPAVIVLIMIFILISRPSAGQRMTYNAWLPLVKNNFCSPEIRFTFVPPLGSFENLRGEVNCVRPANFKVAVYLSVNNGWWTKPYWNQPLTTINSDGSWSCDITTGGVDQWATELTVFLIPNGYSPPLMAGGQNLPPELFQKAVIWANVNRTGR